MTYPAPDKLPYDAWFDDNYKYNPLDSMPIATDKTPVERLHDDLREEKLSMHEKMYRLAIEKHNPWGSEGFHTGPKQ